MGQYIRIDSKFAGSIGDGKAKTPKVNRPPRGLPSGVGRSATDTIGDAHRQWLAARASVEELGETVWVRSAHDGTSIRTVTFPDGRACETKYERSGVAHELSRLSERHFLGGVLHDPADTFTPALQVWKDDRLTVSAHLQHGVLQDPPPGHGPAVLMFEDGMEIQRIHYAAGKEQDPAPGWPARVVTRGLGTTVIVQSTFYTDGRVTEQMDSIPVLLGDGRTAVVTSTSVPG